MVKLIALDLDGTLLNDNQMIDNKTIKALKLLKDKGIKIVLCSSRPLYRMKKYLKLLDLNCTKQYTISFNGGLIVENNSDNGIFINYLQTEEVKEIIKLGKDTNIATFLYEKDNIIANFEFLDYTSKNPDSSLEVRDFNLLNLSDYVFYKIIFYGEIEDINKFKETIPNSIKDKFKVTSSHFKNIEIVPKENSKSKGLEKISRITGILPEEMAAFGDNDNDLDMFEYVEYSVAMGNAIDSIKKVADYITLSNNESGIAYAIEKMIVEKII